MNWIDEDSGEADILLSDGEIPKDITEHEYVEVDIARIDI
ncbi:hypothetical protein B835_346 [Enterococcus mundtii 3F]|nr:hypothetical protein [Enterococcus mundtii 3F]